MNVPGNGEKDLAKFAQAIREMAQGGSNALGDVTLAAGTTSTTVSDTRCTEGAKVDLCPLSAASATATVWLAETRRGGFVLGHDAGGVGRAFRYEIRRP